MPISLRLPLKVEQQIAEYGARQGLTKSAVIVRSIETFLAEHAEPNAYQLYLDVMQEAAADVPTAKHERRAGVERPHKLAIQKAMQKKHAERSARAAQALKAKPARRKAA